MLDIILPRSCLGCGKEGKYVCEKCGLFLSEVPSLFQQGSVEEVISGWEYEGLIKEILFKIKYDGMFDAINELIEMAFEKREPYVPEGTIITFVPLFKKKERKRGFNQAELIARKLGKMTGRKVLSLLEKVKDTPSQTKLNKAERMVNVKDSFRKKSGNFAGGLPGQGGSGNPHGKRIYRTGRSDGGRVCPAGGGRPGSKPGDIRTLPSP